jgi:hypothetical protein
MNREHPTCTEQKLLNYECGWKGGDRGGLAERKKWKKSRKEQKKLLTGIGLLMEGPSATSANNFRVADNTPASRSMSGPPWSKHLRLKGETVKLPICRSFG